MPGPVVDAAAVKLDERVADAFEKIPLSLKINGVKHKVTVTRRAAPRDFLREQLHLTGTNRFIAGGTNLVDLMKRGVMTPQKLVDINRLPLAKIETVGNGRRPGALALNATVANDAQVRARYPC